MGRVQLCAPAALLLLIDSTVVYLHAGMPDGSGRAVLHAEHAEEERGGERRKSEGEGEAEKARDGKTHCFSINYHNASLLFIRETIYSILIVSCLFRVDSDQW